MTRRTLTDEERIASIREVIEAARGDWHEATALLSVGSDLSWLLANAERWSVQPVLSGLDAREALARQLPTLIPQRRTMPPEFWRATADAILAATAPAADEGVRIEQPERFMAHGLFIHRCCDRGYIGLPHDCLKSDVALANPATPEPEQDR